MKNFLSKLSWTISKNFGAFLYAFKQPSGWIEEDLMKKY